VNVDPIALATLREMQRRRMTISDLSERTGVDRSVLGRWLGGVRSIRVRDAAKVMEALGLVVVSERDHLGKATTDPPAHRTKPP